MSRRRAGKGDCSDDGGAGESDAKQLDFPRILCHKRRSRRVLETPRRPLTNQQVEVAVATESIPQVVRTFKYRLLPTRKQHAALADILESQRVLYNAALQERIDCYRKTGRGRNYYDQCRALTELRREPEYATLPVNIQRGTIKWVHGAYDRFFRRVKAGERAGFPRFRGKGRWQTFWFAEFSGIRLATNRIAFQGLPGTLLIHLHRPLPKEKPLTCTFTRDHKGWSICLQYRVPVTPLPATVKRTGVDVGITHLATLSTGEAIPNPRTAKRAERELRRRQRALARCKRGSNRRRKVKAKVTRLHARIRNTRNTYLHQISARLVRENDLIAVEDLNVKSLAAGMLAKSVNDAAWAKLKEMLAYKAEWAGRQLVEVDCRGTSQTCPACGAVAKKLLSERVHRCSCGCTLDRDHAAALVILHRAVAGPGVAKPLGAAA